MIFGDRHCSCTVPLHFPHLDSCASTVNLDHACCQRMHARHGGHLEATPVDPFPLLAAQSKQKEKKSKGLATAHSSSSSSSAAARAHRRLLFLSSQPRRTRLAGSASSSFPPVTTPADVARGPASSVPLAQRRRADPANVPSGACVGGSTMEMQRRGSEPAVDGVL